MGNSLPNKVFGQDWVWPLAHDSGSEGISNTSFYQVNIKPDVYVDQKIKDALDNVTKPIDKKIVAKVKATKSLHESIADLTATTQHI